MWRGAVLSEDCGPGRYEEWSRGPDDHHDLSRFRRRGLLCLHSAGALLQGSGGEMRMRFRPFHASSSSVWLQKP